MQYVMLIYQSHEEWAKLSESERAAISPEYAESRGRFSWWADS